MKKCFTLLAWLLLAVVFLLPACQPTPEQEAVIDKNDFEDSIVEKSPEATEVEEPAPESIHWDEDFTNANGNITFAVDAEIQLAARYPVLEERPIDLNEEYMMEKIEALVGENPQLFTVDSRKTKAQIQDEIVQYKAEIEQTRQMIQEGNTNEMLQEELDQSDERLAELEQQYAEAPETLEEEPLAALAFETNGEGSTSMRVKAVGPNGTGRFEYLFLRMRADLDLYHKFNRWGICKYGQSKGRGVPGRDKHAKGDGREAGGGAAGAHWRGGYGAD